jgi:methionyl-tRNA formyltransferase
MIASWAASHGHRIVLVVTSPAGDAGRYRTGYLHLVESLPPTQDVLITTRMRRTAAPVISALAPDLIIAATFPHRIPPQVTAIPRYGTLNLHPSPLPRGRGPNPMRLIYDGDLVTAGTVHRIAPEFDAGPILGQQMRQLPASVTPQSIIGAWGELLIAALDEGVARALAGDPGDPQDETIATFAAPFTDDERWLRWDEPALTVQRRAAALNLAGEPAKAHVDGEIVSILDVLAQPDSTPPAPPGTVLSRTADTARIQTTDGIAEITMRQPEPTSG